MKLNAVDRAAGLHERNACSTPGGSLALHAAAKPAQAAIVVAGRELTYGAWLRQAVDVAAGLRSLMRKHDEPVVLLYSAADWIEFATCYIGAQEAGMIPVVASPFAHDAAVIGDETGAAIVLTTECRARRVRLSMSGMVVSILDLRSLVRRARGERVDLVRVAAEASERAVIVRTSGTTGPPKYVTWSFGQIAVGMERGKGVTSHAPVVHNMPPSAASGIYALLGLVLGSGSTAVAVDPGAPDTLHEILDVRRAKLGYMTASYVDALASQRHRQLPHLEWLLFTGDKIRPETAHALIEANPSLRIISVYGCTEAPCARLLMPYDPDRPAAIGYAPPGTEIKLVDRSEFHAKGAGEIAIRSIRRDAVGGRRVDTKWVRTGDLGTYGAGGCLELRDRLSNIVASKAGQIMMADDLERALASDGVREVAVCPLRTGDDLALRVFIGGECNVSEAKIWSRLRREVDFAAGRSELVRLRSLPRTETGKVMRWHLLTVMS